MNNFLHQTEKNKNLLYIAGALCAITIGVYALVSAVYWTKQIKYVSGSNSITVKGTGEISSVPDVAEITFTVRAESAKVTDAQKTVKDKTKAAADMLTKMSVEEKNIKTISYNSYPKYDYKQALCRGGYCPPAGNPTISGYEVSQVVSVKIKNTDQVGTVLEALGALGIQELSGPNFTIDDIEKVKQEAQGLAIKDAKEKAKILADQLDVDIVRIVSFDDGSNSNGYPQPVAYMEKSAMNVSSDSAGGSNSNNGILQGQNKVTSNVTITYEVK